MASSIPTWIKKSLSDLQLYLDTLQHQLISMQRNIKLLAPWLSALNQPPRLFAQAENPTLQAWQDFLDSLPAGLPTLGEAAPIYDEIKVL